MNSKSELVVFDLGSNKTSVVVSSVKSKNHLDCRLKISQYSASVRSSVIKNMKIATENIIRIVDIVENEIQNSVREVIVSVSSKVIKSYYVESSISVGKIVSQNDIKKLINSGISKFNKSDEYDIIHYIPMRFVVDKSYIVDDPTDMYASSISCHMHLVVAKSHALLNLKKCFDNCNVQIKQFISSIYASGLFNLSKDDKNLGTVIIDIGYGTTDFGIFLDGKMIYTGFVSVGGANITMSIAKKFSLDIRIAEKIKILHGVADPRIVIKDIPIDTSSTIAVTTTQLAEVINKSLKKIFTDINIQCQDIVLKYRTIQRVIITGGGSEFSGIEGVATEIFHRKVTIPKDGNNNIPNYSVALGMIKLYLDSIDSVYHRRNFFLQILEWLKRNI